MKFKADKKVDNVSLTKTGTGKGNLTVDNEGDRGTLLPKVIGGLDTVCSSILSGHVTDGQAYMVHSACCLILSHRHHKALVIWQFHVVACPQDLDKTGKSTMVQTYFTHF